MPSSCEVDDPNSLRFCDQRELDIPYTASVKLAGSYSLPYGVQLSGSWQGYPGTAGGTARQDSVYDSAINRVVDSSLNVNYQVTNAIIRASNPNVTLTQASFTIPASDTGHEIPEAMESGGRPPGKEVVKTLGSTLDRPTAILQGRLLAVGLQVNFF